jgi:hypothetical protein
METAKVDIRKLQLLNDRINQCIDALNQVRLSVHGLAGAQTGIPGAFGAGQTQGLEYGLGLTHSGLGQTPFSQIGQNPFAQNPFAQSAFGQATVAPFGTPNVFPQVPSYPGIPPTGFSQPGFGGIGVNPLMAGLAHSGPETLEAFRRSMWADPLLTARIVQTFPYAQLPVPPVVNIY